jgi:hypothetical protein
MSVIMTMIAHHNKSYLPPLVLAGQVSIADYSSPVITPRERAS